MGMAASQARLLSLTSRLHDIEYQAQNIESRKIQLATQKDELYDAYCEALDAKKIQVAYDNGDGTRDYVDANFSTLCGYSESRFQQYALTDSRTGKVIVNEDTADAWDRFSNDKYSFAWAMLDLDAGWVDSKNDIDNRDCGSEIGITDNNYSKSDCLMTEVEQIIYNKHSSSDGDLKNAYEKYEEAESSGTAAERKEALDNFRDVLYGNDTYFKEIKEYMCRSKLTYETKEETCDSDQYDKNPDEVDQDEFNYYVNLYELIAEAGGCTTIDPQFESGDDGENWLNNMVSSGRVLINMYKNKEWSETSVSTSTNSNYIQEVQDEADLKKAEATYEYELDKINDKDTDYDNELSKLESERTSITTEIESVEKVRDDNIDRTFGIFS